MVNYKEMGLRIKRLRRSKDLTQEKLAAITGYSKSFIGCVENNTSTPSIETICKISLALGVTPDYFLLGSVQPTAISQRVADKLRLCTPEDQETIEILVDALVERHLHRPTK